MGKMRSDVASTMSRSGKGYLLFMPADWRFDYRVR